MREIKINIKGGDPESPMDVAVSIDGSWGHAGYSARVGVIYRSDIIGHGEKSGLCCQKSGMPYISVTTIQFYTQNVPTRCIQKIYNLEKKNKFKTYPFSSIFAITNSRM